MDLSIKAGYINNKEFYRNKRVLITGHTGFKGAWFTAVLNYLGANALGYSLAPEKECLFSKIDGSELIQSVTGDILDYDYLKQVIEKFKPEIVFHLAAFGFINECYNDPLRAYNTNVIGTVNLLEALRKSESLKSIVLISSDKVYENKGDGAIYKESESLGGLSPYSGSKTCMEFAINDYAKTYFKDIGAPGISIARASNVLAGGDHIKSRLIPSILNAIDEGIAVELRNPCQTRPWQSVLDAIDGYLTLGRLNDQKSGAYDGAWNIGPTSDGIRSVQWVYETMKKTFHGLSEQEGKPFETEESKTLGLDICKMLEKTDWEPRLSCEKVIAQVVEFYNAQSRKVPERTICMQQIADYYGGLL